MENNQQNTESNNLLNNQSQLDQDQEEIQKQNLTQKLENLIQLVGGQNRYQYCFTAIFSIQFMVTVFLLVGQLYFVNEPSFLCPKTDQTQEKDIIVYDGKEYYQCKENKGGCDDGSILDPNQKYTISINLDLYCQNSDWRAYVQSSSLFGSVFGNFIIAYFAENYGRKKVMLYSWGISTLGIIGVTCAFDKIWLIIFNFIAGFGIVPCNSINFIIINEQSNDNIRQKGTTLLIMSWGLYQIILALFAYLFNSWRYFFIFLVSIPTVLVFVLNFYVVESPQYLMTKSPKNLQSGLLKIANKNRKQIENQQEFDQQINEIVQQNDLLLQTQKHYNYLDLLRLPSLRLITIASGMSMFISQFVYYGTQMALDNIEGSVYINAISVASGELFADTLTLFIIEKLPRKKSIICFMLLTTILCLAQFGFTDTKKQYIKTMQIIIAVLIRMSTTMSQTIAAVFVEELYPTPTRSLGVGFQMGIGLIGSTIAPIVVDLFKKQEWSQLGCIGVIMIPFNFANLLFRETKGLKLQNFVKEHQDISIDQENNRKNSIINFNFK